MKQFIPGLVAAICLFVTMASQATMYGGLRSHMELGKLHILAVDSVILWKYVGMLVWPSSLCVLYDTPTTGIAGDVMIAVAGWALVFWAGYRWRKQLPFLAFGLLTALVFLLPVLNLTPITTLMNDRYLYLPSIPLFGLATWGIYRACGVLGSSGSLLSSNKPFVQTRIGMMATGFTFAVILIGVTSLTSQRLPVWRNSTALWTDAVEKVPNLPVVQYQLADGLYSAGEKERAIHILNTALANETADSGDRTRFRKTLDNWQANR